MQPLAVVRGEVGKTKRNYGNLFVPNKANVKYMANLSFVVVKLLSASINPTHYLTQENL